MELSDARLVVALGRVALEALGRIEASRLRFGVDTARPVAWQGRQLISLYHPSGQTLGRRSGEQQVADYRVARRTLASLLGACGGEPVAER